MFKIPIIDEVVRSVQSLGDAITGDTAAARRRWENWTNDSYLATGGKTIGLTVASGATALVGKTDTAAELIKKAGENGEKFGATVISSVSQVGGIAAQVVTLGVPNPVSGALNGFASGVNRIIDEDAKGGTNGISWDNLGKEGGIGAAKGAASSGGIIPYAGTAVEKKIRGEKIEFDHKQEWANWGVNVALTAGTAGTVKGTAALTEAGKIGVKRAVAIGGTSGIAMGSGAAFICQEVQSAALERKMKKDGYNYDRDEKLDDGREYAVYTKEGERDIYVPKPDKGDILAQGLLQGVMQGAGAGVQAKKQLKQNEFLPQNYKKRLAEVSEIPDDHVVNRNDALNAHLKKQLGGPQSTPRKTGVFGGMAESEASSISASSASEVLSRISANSGSEIQYPAGNKGTFEFEATEKLAQQLGLRVKYLKLTKRAIAPGGEKGILVLGNGEDIVLLQHATDGVFGKFGPFSNFNARQIFETLRKAVDAKTKTINLLGCHVSEELALQLEFLYKCHGFDIKVNTLPKGFPGEHLLHIDPKNNWFTYWRKECGTRVMGNLEELPKYLSNERVKLNLFPQ